jgi:hypothetical protein
VGMMNTNVHVRLAEAHVRDGMLLRRWNAHSRYDW